MSSRPPRGMDLVEFLVRHIEDHVVGWNLLVLHEFGQTVVSLGEAGRLVEGSRPPGQPEACPAVKGVGKLYHWGGAKLSRWRRQDKSDAGGSAREDGKSRDRQFVLS